jgi:hypothetical protein
MGLAGRFEAVMRVRDCRPIDALKIARQYGGTLDRRAASDRLAPGLHPNVNA